ncbi:MAG: T9SS type A sorting domain-containing protein [Ignavibacteria bacterium]|nr:T9SS type A sorting domain-containing protein [Ignavibacteria bacterium]
MLRFTFSRVWLYSLIVVLFPVLVAAQSSAASRLSDADYSQLLLNRLHKITSKEALMTGQKPNRANHNMTMLLLDAKKNWNRLTTDAQKAFSVKDTRPTGLDKKYLETTKNFFQFYYTTTGTNAVATTDANANGVPDYVENMAAAFCKALSFYDSVGFSHPPLAASDNGRYAVYLSSSDAGDYVYGYSQPETNIHDNPATPIVEQNAYTSFMVMRSEYNDFGNTAAEKQIAMEVTAAHEFFHAVQFGYETENMEGYLMEMCSTWAEDKVFPGDDDNWQYLTDIFNTPDVSTDWDEALDGDAVNYSSDYSMHWYAAWIFMRYVTDQTESAIVKNIFENNITVTTSSAIDNALKSKGSSYTDALKNYYVALGLLTSSNTAPMSKYRFQRADDYRTLTRNSGGSPAGPFVIKYENTINYTGSKVTYSSTSKGDKRLMRASADFIKITPNGNFSISVAPKTANTNFTIRLLKSDSYTNPTKLAVVEPTITGSNYVINVPDYASYSKYVLVLYNAKYSTAQSRDTTSIQYDITVDKAQLTDGVALDAPVGGESWQIGTIHNILWESANVTNVKLEYTTDNGTTWSTIIASTPAAAGTYAWTVPNTASTNCKVRVSDAANAASNSASPAVFSIIQPLPFGIITPNGGETWYVTTNQNISWNPNTVVNVKVEYTTDNGTTWSTVVASTPANVGSYQWTIPNTVSTTCKVRLSSVENAAITSMSASAFSIAPKPVSITIISEDFAKVTTGSITSPGSIDIGTALDTYTQKAGWTGSKVYAAGGAVKVGASSNQGYIVTPAIDLSGAEGKGQVNFDAQMYGTDTGVLQVMLSTDGGTTFTQVGSDVTPAASMSPVSVSFTGGKVNSMIKITAKVASKNRFYLDNISVISGGSSAVDDGKKSQTLPQGFVLGQNYPNPFNPSTTISFSIPESGNVQLTIFNQLGERVASLVNGHLNAGAHSVVWNAANQVSGIYFYQLSAGNYSVVKKLVLMK